jgi:3'(2'), 5'-bisphosphate nucleotidase
MTETLLGRAEHDTAPAGDAAVARWLAARAGELLLRLRAELGHADPAALRAAGDGRSHELIAGELGRWRPADRLLSEEGADDLSRVDAERVWIVDPLDGTREYGEEGRADWAVHIALWQCMNGIGKLAAAAVALPAQHRVLATDAPPAYPPMSPLAAEGGPLRFAASRTRPPEFVTGLAADLGAELVPMGSAGAKIAAVIDGDVDAYVHAGGQYEWDSAAPVAVATATGLHASRIDGCALEYNRANPRLPDLVVCRKDLAPRLLAALERWTG